ncbi:hypothetical protein [Clostridium tunisiense]|uniref:hypothetical protein n=1 Tax=Clostridium tunisiense TaxID=219748 RepID=UPI0002DAEB99|nr:hypothetical protein [Clostridium tunisiense]
MLLKIIADLALQEIETSGKDIGQAVVRAINTIKINRNMSQEEIVNRVKEECQYE